MKKARPVKDRFFEKVKKSPSCWEWVGPKNNKGYGTMTVGSRTDGTRSYKFVHRISWELHNGPIPEHDSTHGTCVCHKCDNPSCVNPDHLFLGTHSDNMADMAVKGRASKEPTYIGENHPIAKLDDSKVRQIRKYHSAGACTQLWLAQVYGVSNRTIANVANNEYWKHVA